MQKFQGGEKAATSRRWVKGKRIDYPSPFVRMIFTRQKRSQDLPQSSTLNFRHTNLHPISSTHQQLGFIDYIIGETPYNNVRSTILAEKDLAKQAELRRTIGTTVDYFLTSMAAVTETGAMAHGDLTGSKVGGVAFGAKNVIVVVGSNKIVKDVDEAYKRTMEWCVPAAGAFSREVFKAPGTSMSHYELLLQQSPFTPGRIQVLLVNEALGF